MKFIRFVLAWSVVALVVVAVLVGISFSPVVQTWAVRRALGGAGGLHGGVDSVFAGPRSAEIDKLQVAGAAGVFTAPHISVHSSVWDLISRRTLVVKTLAARGWTLDFTHRAPAVAPEQTDEEAAPAAAAIHRRDVALRAAAVEVTNALRACVGSDRLPIAVSLGDVDLEGNVLWPDVTDEPPIVIHVVIRSGGLSAAHPGDFVLTADTADMRLAAISIKLESHFRVAMATPKTFARLEWTAAITTGDQANPAPWSIDAGVARAANGADLKLSCRRGERKVAGLGMHFANGTQHWTGTWSTEFLATDLTAWLPDRVQPLAGLKGSGDLAADGALMKIKLGGRLAGSTVPHVVWLPTWPGPGEAVRFAATFEATQEQDALQIDAAQVVATGNGTAEVKLTAIQPFILNETQGALSVKDAGADALRVNLQSVPLAWVGLRGGHYAFADGEVSGELLARKSMDGWTVPTPASLRATGVSLLRGERVLSRNIDLVAKVRIDRQAGLWQVRIDPMEIGRADGRLAVLHAEVLQTAGTTQSFRLTGRGQADLTDRAWQSIWPRPGLVPAHQAIGDFAGTIGAETKLQGKLSLLGATPTHSIAASYTLTGNADGSGEVVAPLRIKMGGGVTELSADLKWGGDDSYPAELDLDGEKIDFEPLRRLAAAAGLLPGVMAGGPAKNATSRVADRVPFWSFGPQRIDVQFDQVHLDGHDFMAVGGTLMCDPTVLKLEGGHALLGHHTIEPIAGSITFDPASLEPYRLEASAAVTHVGAGWFFGFPKAGLHPQVEGYFDAKGSIRGAGANFSDLGSRLREEFHLHGTNGITRLLQTNVDQFLPPADKPEKMADSLVNVGSAVGTLFGAKAAFDSGRIKLSPAREAVLNLDAILAEVGYDDFTIDGERTPDGRITLNSIALIAPEERLTGRGEIAPLAGLSLLERPFKADLQLAVKGGITPFFTKAKLLSAQRDSAGYANLEKICHWGGTLAVIDPVDWRQLLIEAATRTDPVPTKGP